MKRLRFSAGTAEPACWDESRQRAVWIALSTTAPHREPRPPGRRHRDLRRYNRNHNHSLNLSGPTRRRRCLFSGPTLRRRWSAAVPIATRLTHRCSCRRSRPEVGSSSRFYSYSVCRSVGSGSCSKTSTAFVPAAASGVGGRSELEPAVSAAGSVTSAVVCVGTGFTQISLQCSLVFHSHRGFSPVIQHGFLLS
jgi:hypothetical protein